MTPLKADQLIMVELRDVNGAPKAQFIVENLTGVECGFQLRALAQGSGIHKHQWSSGLIRPVPHD